MKLNKIIQNIQPYIACRFISFLKIFIAQTVYTGCARTNHKTVPVTNFNKYLHYGTSGTEWYVYKYRSK